MAPHIYENISDAFGNTPLVRINRLAEGAPATILAKLEFYSPASSVKDRLGVGVVNAAEASGALKPGGTIVEATSGNTGIALALIGAARGYRVILAMPETMSMERRMVLRAYGAELVLTEGPLGMKGAVEKANEIVANTPGAILANQFANEANPAIHRATTAEEIWRDTDGGVDIFIAGVGTGGTITGTAMYLKEKNPGIQIIGAQPQEGSRIPGIRKWPQEYLPKIYDPRAVDELVYVSQDDAEDMCRRLAREEGIFAGISAAGACWVAQQIALREQDATIVFVVCDRGDRYLSTGVFPA